MAKTLDVGFFLLFLLYLLGAGVYSNLWLTLCRLRLVDLFLIIFSYVSSSSFVPNECINVSTFGMANAG